MLTPPQFRSWGALEPRRPVYAVKPTRGEMEVVFPFFVASPPSAPHPRSLAGPGPGHGGGRSLGIKQEPHSSEDGLAAAVFPPSCFGDQRHRRPTTSQPPPGFDFPQPPLGAHGLGAERLQRQVSSSGGEEVEELGLRGGSSSSSSSRHHSSSISSSKMPLIMSRARREFVPEAKKDDVYWAKRIKNNASARRSRIKRKALEVESSRRLLELERVNLELRQELAALKRRFGLAAADCVGLQTPPPMPGDCQEHLDVDDSLDDEGDGILDSGKDKTEIEDEMEGEEEETGYEDRDEEDARTEGESKMCIVTDTPPASLPPLSPNSLSSAVSNRSWSPVSQSSLSPRADAVLPLKCRLKGGQHSAFLGAAQGEGERAVAQVH